MKSEEIFNKIEEIIYAEIEKSEVSKTEQGIGSENNLDKNSFKEMVSLIIRGIINFVKAPFNMVAKYLNFLLLLLLVLTFMNKGTQS
jgi:hypothetical protein